MNLVQDVSTESWFSSCLSYLPQKIPTEPDWSWHVIEPETGLLNLTEPEPGFSDTWLYLNQVCWHLTEPEPGFSDTWLNLNQVFESLNSVALASGVPRSNEETLKYLLFFDGVKVEQHVVLMDLNQISKPCPEPRPSQETGLAGINLWTSDLHTFCSSPPSWRGLRCHREGRGPGLFLCEMTYSPPISPECCNTIKHTHTQQSLKLRLQQYPNDIISSQEMV